MQNNKKFIKILNCWIILIYFLFNFSYANTTNLDLEKQLEIAPNEVKIEILMQLIDKYKQVLPETSIEYSKQLLVLIETIEFKVKQAKALHKVGIAYEYAGKNAQALNYFHKSLSIFEQIAIIGPFSLEIADSYLNLGIVYWRLDKYEQSLDYCSKALNIYKMRGSQAGIANALHNIGTVYDLLGRYDAALERHFDAMEIRKNLDDQTGIAESLNSIGIIYYFKADFSKAEEYYLRSLAIQVILNDSRGIAKTFNNVGIVYSEQKKYKKALEFYFKSLKQWKKIANELEIANVFNNIASLYIILKKYHEAQLYLEKAEILATKNNAKYLLQENAEFFSNFYLARNNYKKALKYYKQATKIKSEIVNEKISDKIADMQATYESEKQEKEITLLKKDNDIKQLEVDRQKILTNSFLGGFLFVFILVFILYNRFLLKKKANIRLGIEKEKSDKLLLNILPCRVANDLKETGRTEPESFENVTIYFSDIVDFTTVSSHLEPKLLINELNTIFTAFDNIVEKYHSERIKTIGDAYLCVCGMPEEEPNHAENIIKASIEIIQFLTKYNQTSSIKWKIRIGVHTGKVVGGVVGVKKYIYDVFGDAINTASRMESNSEPMRINISEETYNLVKDKFKIIKRGSIAVKGKGNMKMYFIDI